MNDSRRGLLAGALAALALTLGAAAPASAQNIANPVGRTFSGTNQTTGTPPVVWSFGGGSLVVRCTHWTADGTPPPATVGVVANTIGGPSTRMARFVPGIGLCTATRSGVTAPAQLGLNSGCDWAFSIDAFSAGTGTSTPRLHAGIGCTGALVITIPNFSCQILVSSQTLVDNGSSISITGQNFPANPFAGAGMTLTVNAANAFPAQPVGCAGVGTPPYTASFTGTVHVLGAWAGT